MTLTGSPLACHHPRQGGHELTPGGTSRSREASPSPRSWGGVREEVEAGRLAPPLDGDLALVAGRRVLVALSGGPDSTALLLWLVAQGVDVAAAHYDHALRPGSERDAVAVARLCARL